MIARIQRLLISSLLWGQWVATTPGLAAPNQVGQIAVPFNGSTAVRLLLERHASQIELRAVAGKLIYRRGDNTPWKKTAGVISLQHSDFLPIWGRPVVEFAADPASGGKLLMAGETYHGTIKIHYSETGLWAVNYVDVEDYLTGILAGEMQASWPLQALRAQAVAARTYAFYMKSRPKHQWFDLEGSIRDQVYNGAGGKFPKVPQAVQSTRGLVLANQGKVFKAFYHSRCGGTTELASTVWNSRDGGKGSVECPFCRKNPFRWQTWISQSELRSRLSPQSASLRPLALELGDRTLSGRIAFLKVRQGRNEKKIQSDELRSLLGYTRLKSTHFEWETSEGGVLFKGLGNGHGVGLCQWGTRYFAERGWTAEEILKHYYPGAALVPASALEKNV